MINIGVPNLIIIAGPNGAGKSTVVELLTTDQTISNCVNADVIAKGMAIYGEGDSHIGAGRVLLRVVHTALEAGESVTFESTMAGRSWISLMQAARSRGYDVTICFVAVRSPELALARVAQRVSEGGHDIPEETLRRRYARSLRLWMGTYRHMAQHWYFFDNSGNNAQLIAAYESGAHGASRDEIYDPEAWVYYLRHTE